MWCARHRQKCQPATRNMDGNITGSPCQPWSRAGKKNGLLDPRSTGLWVWIAWVQTVEPLWAIHENVCGFCTSLIDDALGCSYTIFHIQSDPCHLGFTCIRRPRIYSVLLRKGFVRVVHDLHLAYNHVREVLRARGRIPMSDLFFAVPSERLEEEHRKRQRLHFWALLNAILQIGRTCSPSSKPHFVMTTWACGSESAGRIQHRTNLVCSTCARIH